jgi:hypothetical protein
MQERLLQVLSLGEQFHNERRMDKLKRTRVPPIGEHVGNVTNGEVVVEHIQTILPDSTSRRGFGPASSSPEQ